MVGGALKMASMDDLDLRMSDKVRPLYDAVVAFIRDDVDPITEEFHRLGEGRADRWSWGAGQLELLEGAKAKARAQGLWNFFLPDADTGEGLSNLDYAYIANELGKNRLASECLNCSAPDTGNMEVLERVGTTEQKHEWLEPLLRGEIRSAYVMTEPGVMSSDAKRLDFCPISHSHRPKTLSVERCNVWSSSPSANLPTTEGSRSPVWSAEPSLYSLGSG